MIAFVWIFSFGMLVPPLAEFWGTLGLDEQTFSCTILKKNDHSPKKFLMIFGFLMPCIVIIACYSAIFFKVRQSRKNVQAHMNNAMTSRQNASDAKNSALNAAQSAQRREDIRLTKMMLTIFLCFLVCFLPLMLVNVADDDVQFPFLHIVASVLAWASAVVNPFIYAFKNRQYQQAFIKVHQQILCCGREPNASGAPPRGANISKESRTSASKTFLTDMLHFSTATDKIRMMRQNHQQSRAATGNSNAELVSSTVQIGGLAGQNGRSAPVPNAAAAAAVTSSGLNEIPLTSNSTQLTVPSFQNSHLHQNSGIQIKDSEIV